LNWRTNNTLAQNFGVNNLNELTAITRNTTSALTVVGTTTSPATNVTVNAAATILYGDSTFASSNGFTPANGNNTFTAIAQDSLGRLSTNSVTAYLPASTSYTYDLNGNLLSEGTRNFAYDDENELTNVTVPGAWMSQFVYDGKMRMRVRKEFSWNGASFTQTNEVHYVYDGNAVIQERNASNLPQITYTRGKDLSGSLQWAGGIGGLLARSDMTVLAIQPSLAHSYYHADGNGNITAMIDASQALVAKYLYDPFGNTLSLSGPLANANVYRFSSKEYHQPSGALYYLFRFYDPSLQRWLNRDPIEEHGGINLYAYVGNSPANWVDPFGLTLYPPTFIGPILPTDTQVPWPPSNIPGGPWQWYSNPQNPWGGGFLGPNVPGGRRTSCTWAPPGSVNNNKNPYFKDGKGRHYDGDGNPIGPDQAHPSPNKPPQTPPTTIPVLITPGVPGLPTYPTTVPTPAEPLFPILEPFFP
jgi:RHS repeat-associated protein